MPDNNKGLGSNAARSPHPSTSRLADLLGAARQAIQTNRLSDARNLATQALVLEPRDVDARLALAMVESLEGNLAVAGEISLQVWQDDPTCFIAASNLGEFALTEGRSKDAVEWFRKVLALRPQDPTAMFKLARAYLANHEPAPALELLNRVSRANPRQGAVEHERGLALYALGRPKEAAEAFRQAIGAAPKMVSSHVSLGEILLAEGDFAGAIRAFEGARAASPFHPLILIRLARVYVEVGQLEKAETILNDVIGNELGAAPALALLGRVRQQQGRFDEANDALERALKLDPNQPGIYHTIANGRRFRDEDRPMVDRMEAVLKQLPADSEDARTMHYALGKAYDDLGDIASAIGHFDAANALSAKKLREAGRTFDLAALRRRIDFSERQFTADSFKPHRETENGNPCAILIVGMPRSGTTLVEQILSCHPEIGAAGELTFWTDRDYAGRIHNVRKPEIEELRAAGLEYIKTLAAIAPGKRFVTDKAPQNYLQLGPIHLARPDARIVHCRRNPVDTCLSIYMTVFFRGPEYAHDRDELVATYREYRRMMEHWRTVLPPDRFMEIDYEEVVQDQETVTRRMLDFVGVPWDASCLNHEASPHMIATPSVWQARQPTFRTSIARWRRYEPWLGSLRELL